MKKITPIFLFFFAFVLSISVFAQDNFNGSFERLDREGAKPDKWFLGTSPSYLTQLDSTTKISGKYALSLEASKVDGGNEFGVCSAALDAEYEGKTIELRGFMKTEDVDGWCGLWLRLDGEERGQNLGFDNMQKRNIQGTNDWKEYSIELELKNEVHNIVYGGLLIGTGKIWLDDFQILIDGKPFSEAPKKIIERKPAELDTEFNEGSGIEIGELTAQKKENLLALGKIWGFLKYHHPEIAKGNHNWDFELFRVLSSVLEAKNAEERSNAILEWMNKLGKVPMCISCPIPEEYEIKPDFSWMNDEKLVSSDLKKRLNHILKNRNKEEHFYIGMARNVGNPSFKHEKSYSKMDYPDDGFRLLALYRYWNIIEYFFPYKDVIGRDWNDVFEEFLPMFLNASDALEYRLATLTLIENIHDTHANIWGRDEHISKFKGEYLVPFQVKFIENQAVVTEFVDEEKCKGLDLKVGDVITSIDGKKVEAIVKERLPYYPASNKPTKLRDIGRFLLSGDSPSVSLEIEGKDRNTIQSFQRYTRNEINFIEYRNKEMSKPCYEMLADDIGYINLGRIDSKLLPEMFEKFKNTKGIVIDIRNYPSEFVVFTLGRYLMPQPTEFVKFTKGDVKNPGYFTWTPTIKVGEENPEYYKGKVVILINETSQSQAEYTTMAFRVAPKATVIGSTTAGADGNVSGFELPGGVRSMISGIGVFYPDGTPTQRVGIVPDVELTPTISGIREGKDELLDKAMMVIRN